MASCFVIVKIIRCSISLGKAVLDQIWGLPNCFDLYLESDCHQAHWSASFAQAQYAQSIHSFWLFNWRTYCWGLSYWKLYLSLYPLRYTMRFCLCCVGQLCGQLCGLLCGLLCWIWDWRCWDCWICLGLHC